MSKFKVTIIILVAIVMFAGADYYLNNLKPETNNTANTTPTTSIDSAHVIANTSTSNSIKLNGIVSGYKVVSQVETNQIFDKIDLSSVNGIKVYRNKLEKEVTVDSKTPSLPSSDLKPASPKIPTVETSTSPQIPNTTPSVAKKVMYLYEIYDPKGQGSVTYLKVKNQFIAQIQSGTETINETSSLGTNSFFFNNLNYKNTAFILVQISDKLFAFQYDKQDSSVYEDIKTIIKNLSSK